MNDEASITMFDDIASRQREIDTLTLYISHAPEAAASDRERLGELLRELNQARARASVSRTPQGSHRTEPNGTGSGSRLRGGVGVPPLKQSSIDDTEAQLELCMPSVVTALAGYFALQGVPLVRLTLRNHSATRRTLCVSSRIEGYSATAIDTVQVQSGGQVEVTQFPPFLTSALASLTEFCVGSLWVEVVDVRTNTPVLRRTLPLRLLAKQTAVLYQLDPSTGSYRDLRHTLGAWVTPNAPAVLELLRTAADFSRLRGMRGYQVDEAGVREHVQAIFEALKAAEIRYINSVDAFGGVDGQFIQRIRTPSESLACRSCNCIDGTLLVASLLEATGIVSGIVLVPGHAYLGWLKRKPDSQEGVPPEVNDPVEHRQAWAFLETTLIGSGTFEQACEQAEADASRQARHEMLTLLPVPSLRRQNITPLE